MLAPEWAPHPRSLRPVNVRGPGRVAVVAGATAPRAARRVNETAADVCADQLATATVTSAPAVHGLSCMAARGRWGFPPPTTGVQADHACFIFSAQRCFQRRPIATLPPLSPTLSPQRLTSFASACSCSTGSCCGATGSDASCSSCATCSCCASCSRHSACCSRRLGSPFAHQCWTTGSLAVSR